MLQTALLLGAKNDSRTHYDIEDMLAFESQLAEVIKFLQNIDISSNQFFPLFNFTVVNTTRR
jgi:hypothetical protein